MTTAADAVPPARLVTAAGVLLFDRDGRLLIVNPTYKDGWDIPGGYVQPDESPLQAARREIREELCIDVTPGQLLAVDWAPHDDEGDKLLFVFDGGPLDRVQADAIVLNPRELLDYTYCRVDELPARMPARLARRIEAAVGNRTEPAWVYMEHGEPWRWLIERERRFARWRRRRSSPRSFGPTPNRDADSVARGQRPVEQLLPGPVPAADAPTPVPNPMSLPARNRTP